MAKRSACNPQLSPLALQLRRLHWQLGGGGVGKMQALPAVCQPVLPEEAAASPAASPDAPASSKKHEREQAEVRCAFCYESEEMTLAPPLSRALKLTPIPTRSHLP